VTQYGHEIRAVFRCLICDDVIPLEVYEGFWSEDMVPKSEERVMICKFGHVL
jgi:hypothetical protein